MDSGVDDRSAYTFTAASARALVEKAESINSEYARQHTQAVLDLIQREASSANRSLCTSSIPYKYKDVIERRLKALGFTIVYTSDQRDGSYHTITW